MKQVHICSTVYNRYDLLRGMLLSINGSSLMPEDVYIIDHGYNSVKISAAIKDTVPIPIHVITLDDCGGAFATNWILRNVPEERVGIADDALFLPDTIEKLVNTPGDVVTTRQGGFPCCVFRDSCVEKVGWWDENISPGYLYYEDWDYTRRMQLAGASITVADCDYVHVNGGSQTIAKYTPSELAEHNRKFLIARSNYIKKWGDDGELKRPEIAGIA